MYSVYLTKGNQNHYIENLHFMVKIKAHWTLVLKRNFKMDLPFRIQELGRPSLVPNIVLICLFTTLIADAGK